MQACIMTEMLTGQPPWNNGETTNQIQFNVAVKRRVPEVPAEIDVPIELRQVLGRCFAYKQAERATPAEIAVVLRELASTLAFTAEPEP